MNSREIKERYITKRIEGGARGLISTVSFEMGILRALDLIDFNPKSESVSLEAISLIIDEIRFISVENRSSHLDVLLKKVNKTIESKIGKSK